MRTSAQDWNGMMVLVVASLVSSYFEDAVLVLQYGMVMNVAGGASTLKKKKERSMFTEILARRVVFDHPWEEKKYYSSFQRSFMWVGAIGRVSAILHFFPFFADLDSLPQLGEWLFIGFVSLK